MTSTGELSSKIQFQSFGKEHIKELQPGTILWLPRQSKIPEDVEVDPDIHCRAFNHPCVVLSLPENFNINSTVEIAILTSKCKTLPSKFKNSRVRATYLRLVTSSKPSAKDCLHFKNGMGMSRDYASVSLEAFRIGLRGLELYGKGLTHILTKHSLTKLLDAIKSNSLQEKPRKKHNNQRPAASIKGKTKAAKPPRLGTKAEERTSRVSRVSRASSETRSVIVLSDTEDADDTEDSEEDTESEPENWTAPQTRLQKRQSMSNAPRNAGTAKAPKNVIILDDDSDDEEILPTISGTKRHRVQENIGKDEVDRIDGMRGIKKRRQS